MQPPTIVSGGEGLASDPSAWELSSAREMLLSTIRSAMSDLVSSSFFLRIFCCGPVKYDNMFHWILFIFSPFNLSFCFGGDDADRKLDL